MTDESGPTTVALTFAELVFLLGPVPDGPSTGDVLGLPDGWPQDEALSRAGMACLLVRGLAKTTDAGLDVEPSIVTLVGAMVGAEQIAAVRAVSADDSLNALVFAGEDYDVLVTPSDEGVYVAQALEPQGAVATVRSLLRAVSSQSASVPAATGVAVVQARPVDAVVAARVVDGAWHVTHDVDWRSGREVGTWDLVVEELLSSLTPRLA